MSSICPCCGENSLPENVRAGDICPNCFWEYDRVQQKDPAYAGGANHISLNEARTNYASFGVCEPPRFERDYTVDETESYSCEEAEQGIFCDVKDNINNDIIYNMNNNTTVVDETDENGDYTDGE